MAKEEQSLKLWWENNPLRLLVRTLRLYRRFTASEYDRQEFARNLIEIYLDEEEITLAVIREHIDLVLAEGQDFHDLSDVEVCEILDIIFDKVVVPGVPPRAMTEEEINTEMDQHLLHDPTRA